MKIKKLITEKPPNFRPTQIKACVSCKYYGEDDLCQKYNNSAHSISQEFAKENYGDPCVVICDDWKMFDEGDEK